MPLPPPNAVGVEVVATRPTERDDAAISHTVPAERSAAPVAFVVKVRLDPKPPPTAQGWALYVGAFRVPKYWEYPDGIYFKVYDPQFLADNAGAPLRFSQNRADFADTGLVLPPPEDGPAREPGEIADLPSQPDVLGGP